MSTTVVLTPEQRETILSGLRGGLTLASSARLVGRSLSWMELARKANPDFEEQVQLAMGAYDAELTEKINIAIGAGQPALANSIVAVRRNRFPQLYSDDPRLRHSIQSAREDHPDDRESSKVQDDTTASGEVYKAALDWWLQSKQEGKP